MCVITTHANSRSTHPFRKDIAVESCITKGPTSLKEVEQADNNHMALKALSSTLVSSHPGQSGLVLRMVG